MLRVITIEKGQNADVSGILTGDLLLKYDGITTNNKDDLLELISRANERILTKKITVEINREDILIVMKVRSGKLGLTLKPENVEINQQVNGNDSLDKANSTIRLANQRVSELKHQIKERDMNILHLQTENIRLKGEVKADFLGFSDFSDHAIFGVSELSSFDAIKKNYKKLSMVYHPDRGGDPHMMKLINSTFERLKSDNSV
ncbi:hypothetical protein A3Q34_09745 [Colwellia sp. PAMC 20917]|jgi:hypothetical protein|uniref:DnaJ domain-containing protein n=1 Tax=Colwellia sp. PAMC 20917 TaxID=1816218 RepID=UPI0008781EA8|nr:DnaJ domain-containing protein [Colwellia sp. PAMC 20917]AOW77113.1 hypothetical protein A3Q34_09745 [Colwellia sp. PAMC 20917]